jgi:MioC protein
MKSLHFIVGTMLGSSEYVADHLETLIPDTYDITQHLTPNLNDFDLSLPQTWIICTSTHGAGDFPDNIQEFVQQLSTISSLSNISYTVCALGDTNYDTFCNAGRAIDKKLTDLGAKSLATIALIDVSLGEIPEDTAQLWFEIWKDQLI